MRLRLVLLVGLLTLAGAAFAGAAPKKGEILPGGHKIVICHAAGNRFVEVEVDINSIVKGTGHGAHRHDIIPSFDFKLTPTENVQHYPGRNWDAEGEAILGNGCTRPPPPKGKIEVFACVDVHDGTFDATFGYDSNAGEVTIPRGPLNSLSPGAEVQVTEFSDGYFLAAFEVKGITEDELTWTVKHAGHVSTAIANRSSPPCTDEPITPEPAKPTGLFVTCVTNHGSTFDAVFGYENENEHAHEIPIGLFNRFSPLPQDRGQPTTFAPGRHEEAVTVRGIPNSDELTWTLVLTDTRSATATADFDVKCAHPPQPPTPPKPPSHRAFGIFATCATRHGSTYDATFGYVNEDAHVLKIPIGARNSISPGPAGQGQPETFAPGFVHAAFAVRGVPIARSVTWRVESAHGVRVATATARLPACFDTPLAAVGKAAISKSAAPRTAVVGQRVTSTIVLHNNGSAVIQPAEVKDVSHGVRILSVETTQGRCQVNSSAGTHTVHCRATSLAPGGSITIRIAAKATAAGTARDRAAIVGFSDSTPGDNVATAAVHIASPHRPSFTG